MRAAKIEFRLDTQEKSGDIECRHRRLLAPEDLRKTKEGA
jgi:hypothetical protein